MTRKRYTHKKRERVIKKIRTERTPFLATTREEEKEEEETNERKRKNTLATTRGEGEEEETNDKKSEKKKICNLDSTEKQTDKQTLAFF